MPAPKTIPTLSLKLDEIPLPDCTWQKLASFALTFDPHEMGDYSQKAADLNNAFPKSSIAELRAHLYVEQRRWNHFGEEPDGDAMKRLRIIVGLIRTQIAGVN